jgi:hypothetical protein
VVRTAKEIRRPTVRTSSLIAHGGTLEPAEQPDQDAHLDRGARLRDRQFLKIISLAPEVL